MTLAEIIRAQIATGRPLRVTRALLEALEEPLESLLEEDVREYLPAYVLDDGTGDEANERERIEYAGAEIVRLRRERDEARRNASAWADERDAMRRERDEARVEVERLRAERDEASESLRLSVAAWDAAGMRGRDAASVIREAEERGARWALATFFWPGSSALVDRSREAARICEAARKAGEHE